LEADSESESRSKSSPDPETWIENIATAENIPPEEVLERLVSSYWVLEEVQGVLAQTDEHAPSDSDTGPNLGSDDRTDPLDVEAVSRQVSDELGEIRDRLDRLESQSGDESGQAELSEEFRGQLTMLTQRINAIKKQLTDRHRSLESRLDQELEYLIPILGYLIDTTDDLKDTLYAVAEQQKTLQNQQAMDDRLIDLKQQASRLGVHTATCEYCETSVDIQLLPTPDCPECEYYFEDIEPASGWFGRGTNTLTVTEDSPPSP
jgi:hypothetical protein